MKDGISKWVSLSPSFFNIDHDYVVDIGNFVINKNATIGNIKLD